MLDALQDNARQHGIAAADYVVRRLQGESMTPGRASELLNAYVLKQAEDMRRQGASSEDVIAWVRAVETAFDERLAELAGVEPPQDSPEPS